MQGSFKLLNWDSEFFDIKVAQVERNFLSRNNKENLLRQLSLNGVELAYYFSDGPFDDNENDFYNFYLVNRSVPIKKRLTGTVLIHESIQLYKKKFPVRELYELSYRAGEWSRFYFDPNIDNKKVKDLYKNWIEKSVRKELASEILVYKEHGVIKGMITLRIEPPCGQTPLFAVSKDSEGKGLSFALMSAAETVLFQNGCSYVSSATQADNRAAVTVFKRQGCIIEPVEYVYHLWKK